MSDWKYTQKDLDFLLTPLAVRERSQKVFDLCQAGKTQFRLHLDRLEEAIDFVLDIIKKEYPNLDIPYHSRWGHFKVRWHDRFLELENQIESTPWEKAYRQWDLVIVSVLLDAGAGMQWKFFDSLSGESFSKSEGLALASLEAFKQGLFSSDSSHPYQVDADGLLKITLDQLEEAFQVSQDNPLFGVEGRLALLHKLGKILKDKESFSPAPYRPGHLINAFKDRSKGSDIEASQVFQLVCQNLGDIWPSRIYLGENNLGDTWPYPLSNEEENNIDNLVPFHKLSQWLTYSLIEPLEELGFVIGGLDKMTGLCEYRNGGLFLDLGVIELKDQEMKERPLKVDDQIIIEWRALTIILLDKLAQGVQERLGKNKEEFPLVKVLEGGSWRAGRVIAKKLREDGGPPLNIVSDGTVF